jgi:hypothetical protein
MEAIKVIRQREQVVVSSTESSDSIHSGSMSPSHTIQEFTCHASSPLKLMALWSL